MTMIDHSWEEILEKAERQLSRRQHLYNYGRFRSVDQKLEFAKRMNECFEMVEGLVLRGQKFQAEQSQQDDGDNDDNRELTSVEDDSPDSEKKKLSELREMWSTCNGYLQCVLEIAHSLELQHQMIEKFKNKFDRLLVEWTDRSPRWAARAQKLDECATFFKATSSLVKRSKDKALTKIGLNDKVTKKFGPAKEKVLKEKFGGRKLSQLNKDEVASMWVHIVEDTSKGFAAAEGKKLVSFVEGACNTLKGSLIAIVASHAWGFIVNETEDAITIIHDVISDLVGYAATQAVKAFSSDLKVGIFAEVGEALAVTAEAGEMIAIIVGTAGEAILMIGVAALFDVVWDAISGVTTNSYMGRFVSGPAFVVRDDQGKILYD